jgi:alpha-tubulin suppressor-like RCC1 family protein
LLCLPVTRYGQLGHGACSSYVALPTPVAPHVTLGSSASTLPPTSIRAVSCGTYFTLLITEGGQLLAFGRNKYVGRRCCWHR